MQVPPFRTGCHCRHPSGEHEAIRRSRHLFLCWYLLAPQSWPSSKSRDGAASLALSPIAAARGGSLVAEAMAESKVLTRTHTALSASNLGFDYKVTWCVVRGRYHNGCGCWHQWLRQ